MRPRPSPASLLAALLATASPFGVSLQSARAASAEDPTAPPERIAADSARLREEDRNAPPPTGDAAAPATLPEHPGGAAGYSRYVFEYDTKGEIVTTLVEGPRGPQVRVPISYLELKELAASDDPVPEELQMTREQLETLVEQLDRVRASTEKYQDVDAALEAGFIRTTRQVPNMGAHFFHWDRIRDGVFDPSEPEILLYTHQPDGSWRFVGTAFILPHRRVGGEHPEGFAGPLDNWHVHHNLCTGPDAASPAADRETCESAGHTWVSTFGWMIHAWVADDNPLGVFHMWHPEMPPKMPPERIRPTRSPALAEPPPGVRPVSIENFSHATVEVEPGQSVMWVNADSVPHTVTQGRSGEPSGSFDSGALAPGSSFTAHFDEPGEYDVTCTIHPQMNGVVIVREKEQEKHRAGLARPD